MADTLAPNTLVATSETGTAVIDGPREPEFGDRKPRICWIPEHDYSIGPRAVEFCKEVGLTLDDWQEAILSASLNEAGDQWAAREVGVVLPRQNGKNEIVLAR